MFYFIPAKSAFILFCAKVKLQVMFALRLETLHYISLVRRFYPKRLTYSILCAIPTGAIWGEVSQGHNDMLTAVGFEPVTA